MEITSYLLTSLILFSQAVYQPDCTEGLADGNATVDGRPLHWKVRMWYGTNRLQYWDNDSNSDGIPDIDNDGDTKPDLFPFLGIRSNVIEYPNYQNPMMGLNSVGFSIGITVVAPICKGNTDPIMTHSLDNFSKTSEFYNFLQTFPGVQDVEKKSYIIGNTYGVADRYGRCSEFEYYRNSSKNGYIREYRTSNPRRAFVKSKNKTIRLNNIVARSNFFHHRRESGQLVNKAYVDAFSYRYLDAVKNMAKLRDRKSLSVMSLLQGLKSSTNNHLYITLRQNPISFSSINCSTMLIHGIKKNKDARLTTFWVMLGHSDYLIAIPVWILGVQNNSEKKPPHHLETGIVKVNFVNKGGRKIPGAFDYFFEINGEKLFIKITEGKVSRDKIAIHLNKEVEIKGFKSNGLWDTDDPNVQSRIGDYVVIMEFLGS